MTTTYISGLDLGQQNDFSALAVLERSDGPDPNRPERAVSFYSCRHLQRWPLGTAYTQIVARVGEIMATAPLPGTALAIDQTGVGRAVVDIFREARLPCRLRPITITAGAAVSQDEDGYHVPKKELVSVLQVLLQGRRFRVAGALPEAETLRGELQNFRVKITAAGNETFNSWRESQHDDLVLAVAMAAWLGENTYHGPLVIGMPEQGKGNAVDRAPQGVFLS